MVVSMTNMPPFNTDEFVAMHYRFNPTAALSVDWYVAKRCNFSCSYCMDYLHDKVSPHLSLEQMQGVVDKIHAVYGDNVFWSLTGGEPTINPDFLALCQYLKRRGAKHVSLTTNGSRSLEYFKDLFVSLDNITLSLHFEFIKNRTEEYVDKLIAMEAWRKQWRHKTFVVRFMVLPGTLDLIDEMTVRLKTAGVEKIEYRYIRPIVAGVHKRAAEELIALHERGESDEAAQDSIQLVKELEDQWYSPEEQQRLKKYFAGQDKQSLRLYFANHDQAASHADFNYNQLNFERKTDFKNWLCWAGIKHVKIAPNGDLYIGTCQVGGPRTNLLEAESKFALLSEPVRCPKWRCTDAMDLRAPKIRDWKYLPLVETMVAPPPTDAKAMSQPLSSNEACDRSANPNAHARSQSPIEERAEPSANPAVDL